MRVTYSVFARKRGQRSWVRLSGLALPLEGARRVFQGVLLTGSLEYGLEMSLRKAGQDLRPYATTLAQVAEGK